MKPAVKSEKEDDNIGTGGSAFVDVGAESSTRNVSLALAVPSPSLKEVTCLLRSLIWSISLK